MPVIVCSFFDRRLCACLSPSRARICVHPLSPKKPKPTLFKSDHTTCCFAPLHIGAVCYCNAEPLESVSTHGSPLACDLRLHFLAGMFPVGCKLAFLRRLLCTAESASSWLAWHECLEQCHEYHSSFMQEPIILCPGIVGMASNQPFMSHARARNVCTLVTVAKPQC